MFPRPKNASIQDKKFQRPSFFTKNRNYQVQKKEVFLKTDKDAVLNVTISEPKLKKNSHEGKNVAKEDNVETFVNVTKKETTLIQNVANDANKASQEVFIVQNTGNTGNTESGNRKTILEALKHGNESSSIMTTTKPLPKQFLGPSARFNPFTIPKSVAKIDPDPIPSTCQRIDTNVVFSVTQKEAIVVSDANQTFDNVGKKMTEEKVQDEIHRVYLQYLYRPCDPESLQSWVLKIQNDPNQLQDLTRQLIHAPEHLQKKKDFDLFWMQTKSFVTSNDTRTTLKPKTKILYRGIYGTSGIGKAVLGYVTALMNDSNNYVIHFDPSIIQFAPPKEDNGEFEPLYKAAALYEQCKTKNMENDYHLAILHGDPSHWKYQCVEIKRLYPKCRVAGLLVWETDTLPSVWKMHVQSVDFVLTPCRWNVDIVHKAVPEKPVYFWPHVVEKKLSKQKPFECVKVNVFLQGRQQRGVYHHHVIDDLMKEKCNVLVVGQWNARKNIHGTIMAFLDAFTNHENTEKVVLYVKTFIDYGMTDGLILKWLQKELDRRIGLQKEFPSFPLIVVDLQHHSEKFMNQMFEWSHVFFSLAHAEGVGLGACQAFLQNKKVVMPSYGGQVDYIDTNYWIDWTLERANFCNDPVTDHLHCRNGTCRKNNCVEANHKWATVKMDHCISILQKSVHDFFNEQNNDFLSLKNDIYSQSDISFGLQSIVKNYDMISL